MLQGIVIAEEAPFERLAPNGESQHRQSHTAEQAEIHENPLEYLAGTSHGLRSCAIWTLVAPNERGHLQVEFHMVVIVVVGIRSCPSIGGGYNAGRRR